MANMSCKKLKELISDENQAWREYKKLSESTKYPELFSRLSADERRHQISLTLLHSDICWKK